MTGLGAVVSKGNPHGGQGRQTWTLYLLRINRFSKWVFIVF